MANLYSQDPLPYALDALEPIMSKEQLSLHYEKHHVKYVENANKLLTKLQEARQKNEDIDLSPILRSLSFNIGGHVLHTIFWSVMAPVGEGGGPEGNFLQAINDEFGSFDRFKKEFSDVAEKVEGSGWAALTYCKKTKRLILMQIEKHNLNIYPTFSILMCLDVWEHSYYVDYRNDRKTFIDSFWQIVNWKEINNSFDNLISQ